jgi:hypothetical protein
MQVFPHQQPAVDEILARARAYFDGQWRMLSFRPRFHSLLTGPSGAGKSFIISEAASACGATLVRVPAPAWMPAGANQRAVAETIGVIAEAVAANTRTLLAIDEICKVYHKDNPWCGYIRGEIFEILDGRWPQGLRLPDSAEDDSADDATILQSLTTKLRETVYIVGIGTFQEYYDDAPSRAPIGFGAQSAAAEGITAEVLAERLPRELANRFNGSLIRIPQLQPENYQQIADHAEATLPEHMREPFRAETARRIDEAIAAKKGVRYIEECVMEVLKNLPPLPSATSATDEPWDGMTL